MTWNSSTVAVYHFICSLNRLTSVTSLDYRNSRIINCYRPWKNQAPLNREQERTDSLVSETSSHRMSPVRDRWNPQQRNGTHDTKKSMKTLRKDGLGENEEGMKLEEGDKKARATQKRHWAPGNLLADDRRRATLRVAERDAASWRTGERARERERERESERSSDQTIPSNPVRSAWQPSLASACILCSTSWALFTWASLVSGRIDARKERTRTRQGKEINRKKNIEKKRRTDLKENCWCPWTWEKRRKKIQEVVEPFPFLAQWKPVAVGPVGQGPNDHTL